MLFILFFEVYAVVTENVCCCRQEQARSWQQDALCCLPIASSRPKSNSRGTGGGGDTGIYSGYSGAGVPPNLPSTLAPAPTSGALRVRQEWEGLGPAVLRRRACKYLLIYFLKVILCCRFTQYVVCHKTNAVYFDVIKKEKKKKFVILRSKYIIAVFCGLFKGFYLVVR